MNQPNLLQESGLHLINKILMIDKTKMLISMVIVLRRKRQRKTIEDYRLLIMEIKQKIQKAKNQLQLMDLEKLKYHRLRVQIHNNPKCLPLIARLNLTKIKVLTQIVIIFAIRRNSHRLRMKIIIWKISIINKFHKLI